MNNDSNQSDWLTLNEAAKYLKISLSSLYKKATAEEIPASKIGRQWRFYKPKLDDWLLNDRDYSKLKKQKSSNKSKKNSS